MTVEPIGLLIVLAGMISLLLPLFSLPYIFNIAILLGAASAVNFGSGQIQPAHLMLLFVFISLFSTGSTRISMAESLFFPRPGFWLLSFTLYSIASAYYFPRIFASMTYINAIGSTEYGNSVQRTPLGPVSGNFSQSIYAISNFVCFTCFSGLMTNRHALLSVARALILFAFANIFFACVDLLTYYSGLTYLLDPIRNTQYVLHTEEEVGGAKRIVGSFTETSSFAYATSGILAFCGTLAIFGRWRITTIVAGVCSALLLFASTSTTALVSTPLILLLLLATALWHSVSKGGLMVALWFALFSLAAVLFGVLLLSMLDPGLSTVSAYLDAHVLDKGNTQSGVERSSWNQAALENFMETFGVGTGLGTVRASSFLLAVLSNLGLPGAFLFAIFTFTIFRNSSRILVSTSEIKFAARNGCLGLLLPAVISGTLVDLGLEFFVFAALSSSDVREAFGSVEQVEAA